jgi:hypothetical protein
MSGRVITTSGFHRTRIVILHTVSHRGDACSALPVSGSLYNDVVCTVRDIKGGEHDVVDDRDVGRAGTLDRR